MLNFNFLQETHHISYTVLILYFIFNFNTLFITLDLFVKKHDSLSGTTDQTLTNHDVLWFVYGDFSYESRHRASWNTRK